MPRWTLEKRDPVYRLGNKILVGDGCWQYTGGKDPDGYGIFHVGGKSRRVHRYVYELLVGPIPDGLTLDHLCGNRDCVRPAHLEPCASYVNSSRGRSFIVGGEGKAAKTHCPHGHPYAGDNLYINPASGGRVCRECTRQAQRRYLARRQARSDF